MWPSATRNSVKSAAGNAAELERKLEDLSATYQKDKNFYEEALEARMG
jgi:hypothetical protein